MNKEIQYIRQSLLNILQGQPWHGRSVYSILGDVHPDKVHIKPGGESHTLLQLLYHMVTWTEFTRAQIQEEGNADPSYFERLDWREIDPSLHSWEAGLKEFRESNEKILKLLENKEDSFLGGMVASRQYNFRFMLHGLIDHHIYHAAQVAFICKLLS
jgi:uncharacterized damage-inducible protein DinB